jgi:hypothetical protein
MIKRTLSTAIMIGFLIILTTTQSTAGVIQDGAKDMEGVKASAQKALDILNGMDHSPNRGIFFSYCRTDELKGHGMFIWVVGSLYLDAQERKEIMFSHKSAMRREFGCLDTPVTIELLPGDSITKLPLK